MGFDVSGTVGALRAERGWTQEELGRRARMRRTDINLIENGRPVGPARAQRLADALGVSVLELGAPASATDPAGRTLLDHLRELATAVDHLRATTEAQQDRLEALERAAVKRRTSTANG